MEIWDAFPSHPNYKRFTRTGADGRTVDMVLVQKTDRKPSVMEEYSVNGWNKRVIGKTVATPFPGSGTTALLRRQRQLWAEGWTRLRRDTSACVVPRTTVPTAKQVDEGVGVLFWSYDIMRGYRLHEGRLAQTERGNPNHYRVSSPDGTAAVWVASQFLLALDVKENG